MSSIVILSKDANLIQEFRSKFKQSIDYIKVFHIPNEAEDYIRKNEDYLIIIIVSIEFGETIITHIHDLRHLHQIHVYNATDAIVSWTKNYKKIQLVATNLNNLFEAVEKVLPVLINDEETFLKFDNFIHSIWYFKFIQLLIKISKENDDREPLIQYFKTHSRYTEPKQLEKVIKFVRAWSPGTSIHLYTQDSFVYRMLNKAFRLRDFGFLILFRFFIADMHQQICDENPNKVKSIETVSYRGQLMYKNEVESFEENQLICNLGFISTTRNYHLALYVYAGAKNYSITDELQSVLFQIKISSFKNQQLIFSDITYLSQFKGSEEEVLFTLGSYFKITQIRFDNELSCWIIDLIEGYVLDKMNEFKKPFDLEILSIGFYLFILNDNFQLAEQFYETLLSVSNSLTWIIACHVGFGLIEYFKKNYPLALNKFQEALKIIEEENVYNSCKIIGNIYCLIGNVYREMKDYDEALVSYETAINTYPIRLYFIEEKDNYWRMHSCTKKFNSFVRNDKYFYYCDRPLLNKVITYKITDQWSLAVNTFENALNNTKEHFETGDVEMFVKVLGFPKENENILDIILNNQKILGQFIIRNSKDAIFQAYIQLGNHYIDHNCLDYALIYFQEILQYEIEIESFMNVECFYGLGRIYELKKDYNQSIHWLKKAIDYTVTNIVNTAYSTNIFQCEIYENFLFISNEKLNETFLSINYMKEIINNLIKNTNYLDKIYHLITKIYKITIQFYNIYEKTKIKLICNHIIEILDNIASNDQQWLCIGSKCSWKIFQTKHFSCQSILDENYNVYLRLYEKILQMICKNVSDQSGYQTKTCNSFINQLQIISFDHQLELLEMIDVRSQ